MDNLGITRRGGSDSSESAMRQNTVASQARATKPIWPRLNRVHLTDLEKEQRRSFIGGSDANVILSRDAERIVSLWREKRGEVQPEDLSGVLPVMLGCWTEAFNRQWYERVTGIQVRRSGESLVCQRHSWRRCMLDGFTSNPEAVWEAKHTSPFSSVEDVVERYMPQLQHNMAVAQVERATLSIIFGNHKFEIVEVAADWLYQLELLEAEEEFWQSVLDGHAPAAIEPPPAPKPIGVREVSLEGNNAWASAAFDWLRHRDAAKAHAGATTLIKSLVEADVARAFGHGIEAKRSKSGAVTIREFSA